MVGRAKGRLGYRGDSAEFTWVKFDFLKWLVDCSDLEPLTELVYLRLCLRCYRDHSDRIMADHKKLARFCKVSESEFADALAELSDTTGGQDPFIKVREDGRIFIPSTRKRILRAIEAIRSRQIGAAKARRRKELLKQGYAQEMVDKVIEAEWVRENPEDEEDQDDDTDEDADDDFDDLTDDEDDVQPDAQPSDKKREERQEREEREEKKDTQEGESDAVPQLELTPEDVREQDIVRLGFDAWNKLAEERGLPKAIELNADRRTKLKARIAEAGGLDPFLEVLERLGRSRFLTGRTDAGFRADLTFLLAAKSFTRLREGAYDDRKPEAELLEPGEPPEVSRSIYAQLGGGDDGE